MTMLQSRKEFKEVDCGATIPETEKNLYSLCITYICTKWVATIGITFSFPVPLTFCIELAKNFIQVFWSILQKNLNKLFGQPNNIEVT